MTRRSEHAHEVLELGDQQVFAPAGEGAAQTGVVAQGLLDLRPAAAVGEVGQKVAHGRLLADVIRAVMFSLIHIYCIFGYRYKVTDFQRDRQTI